MANGKVSEFFKSNWRSFLFAFALFAGVLCGVWACSKSTPISINARRNVVNISKIK